MAVIDCETCGRRFSSIAGKCPRCGADPDPDRPRRSRYPDAAPYIHYLLAMLLAVGGAGWFYSAYVSGGDTVYPKWMIGVGLVWYFAARVWGAIRRR